MEQIQHVLKFDIEVLQHKVRDFDSSKGCKGATICSWPLIGQQPSSQRRLCEYAMQAIVAKFSAEKDSPVKPLHEIGLSVEDYLIRVARFTSRIEREIALVSGHSGCTPFKGPVPDQDALTKATLSKWRAKNLEAFQKQARVLRL